MHRTFIRVTDAEGFSTDEFAATLSEFPATGAVVTLLDGRAFKVWHPILKATLSPFAPSDERDLPALMVTPLDAPDTDSPQVVEVAGGSHTPPVCHYLTPPGSVTQQFYMSRPHIAGDGMDIRFHGSSSFIGHQVVAQHGRLFLQPQTLLVTYEPRRRFRLP